MRKDQQEDHEQGWTQEELPPGLGIIADLDQGPQMMPPGTMAVHVIPIGGFCPLHMQWESYTAFFECVSCEAGLPGGSRSWFCKKCRPIRRAKED